jgi:hypothetical protein
VGGAPGSGKIRYDNAVPASVTFFSVHETDRNSNDVEAVIAEFRTGDRIKLQSEVDNDYAIYQVLWTSDVGVYRNIVVTHISSSGTFGASENIILTPSYQGGAGGYTFDYLWDSSTSAPPSAGSINFDNATWSSVTNVWVRDTDAYGVDLTTQLDEIAAGDYIRVFSKNDNSFATFKVTSAADSGVYHTYGVTHITSTGSLSDAQGIGLSISFTGDQGDTGITGTQGDTGADGDTGVGASYLYSITVENPGASEDIAMGFTFVAITIQEVQSVVTGTTPSCTIDPYHNTSRSGGGGATDILTSATAITNETTGQNLTSFTDATIPADSWIVFATTAQTGTVSEIIVTMRYTVD